MDSDRLNRWLTLGANIGVLIGIVLLVIELNQNREMMRAQIRNDLAMGIVDILNIPANSLQVSSVIRRANAGEELTADESAQFLMRTAAMFRYWENVSYQYRMGMYDEAEYEGQLKAWQGFLDASPAAVTYWCDFRNRASADFVTALNELIDEAQCRVE